MRRRDFLLGAAGTAAGLALGPTRLLAAAPPDEVTTAFARALADTPWLAGFATASRERFDAPAELVHGALPAGLRGTLYRNGPARHEVGGRRYHHWFDGDGLIQAFRFTDGGVDHRARFVETRKLVREREAGRPLVSGFGTTWPDLPPPRDAADGNPANISVVWHADRLLALWEAADAYALDPETLDTHGTHVWSDETRGVPFSAHPRLEPDGTLWNFGSVPWARMLVLYRIAPDGRLADVATLRVDRPSYLHDFVVTERHLVFVMPPLHFGDEGDTFLARHRWDGNAPTRWLVVDKADLSKQRWFEAPAAFVFHFANAWDDGQGITVDTHLYADASIMFGPQRDVMWGRWDASRILPEGTRLHLDLARGRVREERSGLHTEFPSVDPRLTGRRHRALFSLAQLDDAETHHPLLNALVRQDMDTGAVQRHRFPPDVVPEEHLFVPKGAGDPAAGWVVGTALDAKRGVTQLSVFDAEHVDAGPVATLRLPYALPLGLHGRFVPA